MEHVPGPDFPTAGIINGVRGIHEAYRTGRGRIYIRARSHVEDEDKGARSIVFTELPYQVNKARLLEKIAELVKDKKIEGISGLRDESDKDGMRMVVDLKRGEVAEVVLNNLYQHTQLQNVFGINMVALVDGRPQLLNLKQCWKPLSVIAAMWLRGAPSSICARRAQRAHISGRPCRCAVEYR